MAQKNKSGNSFWKNNSVIIGGIAALIVIAFVGIATFLQSFYQTETYYVLSDEYGDTYPTRTEVTEDMLKPLIIAEGSAPPNALPLETIQQNYVYTKFSLNAGDVLTYSNAGPVTDISSGVPEDWVITNFSVGADNAVGGRIYAGDYFDILVATEDGSFYPFVNVLALDTTVDLSGASSAEAAETEEAYDGQTSQYVVAMSPKNAGALHNVVQKYGDSIRLVISPKQNDYNAPKLSDYNGMFKFEDGSSPIWPGKSSDNCTVKDGDSEKTVSACEITDSNFYGVDRNAAGEPVEQSTTKTGGNTRGDYANIPVEDQKHPDSDINETNEENAESENQ